MQIIIPMAGSGQRFIDAGITEIKPLIKIDNTPIIEHVISMFPGENDFIFICREDHIQNTSLKAVLEHMKPSGKIITISGHKKGPVHSVLQAEMHIRDDQPVLISYCDYYMHWDYPSFKKKMADNAYDGAIPCYKGFHPHLLGNDLYAGCRVDNNKMLLEIKEKHSFTPDKMDTYQSAGAYYFKNGALTKKYLQELAGSNVTVKGEHYISSAYELMIRDDLKIFVEEVPFFCQWGTPKDLKEFLYWFSIFKKPSLSCHPERSAAK